MIYNCFIIEMKTKLIVLFRDPRGTMSSRYDPKLTWCNHVHCKNIPELCRLMRINVNQLMNLQNQTNSSHITGKLNHQVMNSWLMYQFTCYD